MTTNNALKKLTRAYAETTGEKYTAALAKVTPLIHPRIDMMYNEKVQPINGSLPLELLGSYVPLLDLLTGVGWKLINTGPGWNQIVLDVWGNEDWDDNPSIYVGVAGGAVNGNYETTHDADETLDGAEQYSDDIWSMPTDVPLNECKWVYISEGPDATGKYHDVFPLSQQPAGEPVSRMTRARAAEFQNYGIRVMNDGPDFLQNAAKVMNWVADSIRAEAK